MTTPDPVELAREAGRNAYLTEPPERRTPTACPFPPDDPQRVAWLEGFRDAMDDEPHRPTLEAELADELALADKTGGRK